MRNRIFLWAGLLSVAVLLAGAVWLLMDAPHRDIGAEQARFKMVPEELSGILSNGDSASVAYLNAVVELYAVVEGDGGQRATFKGGVVAAWDTTRPHRVLEKGELLRVKGRVTGYDDLFEEVRMDGLVVVQEPVD